MIQLNKKGLLIVLSGPSGVGKDTVIQKMLEDRDDVVVSLTSTTREMRAGETHGLEYNFISPEQFEKMIAAGELMEYAVYSGNYYGTPARPVETLRAEGKHVILEIEVLGAKKIREKCPDALSIFIMPPSMDSLRQRLLLRGTDSETEIENRLQIARGEIGRADEYDYIIINENIDISAAQLSSIITAADCRVERMADIIQEVCDNA